MTRRRVVPPVVDTVHFIGDTHFGSMPEWRADLMISDLDRRMVPTVRAHVQMGDLTDDGTTDQDALALAWLEQLDAPWYAVVGGHDIWDGIRTPAAAAAAWGQASASYVVEFDSFDLIVIEPSTPGGVISEATQNWLDAQLLASGRDCWVACHYPLYDTVGGDPGTYYVSTQDAFYASPDADVRAVLADNPNAKTWVAAHTHSDITVDGLVTVEVIGGHNVATVNCSSPFYIGKSTSKYDPLRSLYLSRLDDGSVEVRFRNHGAHIWDASSTQRVLRSTDYI